MNKRIGRIILSVILCITVILSGCSKSEETVNTDVKEIEAADVVEVVDSEAPKEEKREGIPSPISGIYTEESRVNRRPIAVMLDNQGKARPQAGLDQAEMVYEILAEGGITRYMAIFLINEPESIGPVRSARPYFIEKALEYNALYVHVGGSPQAFADIKSLKVADIDAMSRDGSIFWRKNHKSVPHNMYTSTNAIRKAAKESKYSSDVEFETFKFNDSPMKIDGYGMLSLEIPYYNNYKASFIYNEEEKSYMRYINNKPHLDEVSQKHLYATNIIVQVADSKVVDSEGRLEIDLVGQGKGIFATNGEMKKVTWKKTSKNAITRYFYEDGTEIVLNPGVTWIQVIPSNVEVITK